MNRKRLQIGPLKKDHSQCGFDPSKGMITGKSAENKIMGQMNYIRMYLAGKLVFPPDTREYSFEFNDLEELASLGNGSFGTVKKMRHIPTGKLMAVKVSFDISPSHTGVTIVALNAILHHHIGEYLC
ncbi:unnamed protein product [Cylicocyclus nassatus]|uniref:Protein kinase domain-containing protein n=1 Tax=Cylicocyclus nassatus TaxID=53992 RepID=A0AA36MEN4_CYLNA|nr:unnamed protein product [Cylicocyclus nassatus]